MSAAATRLDAVTADVACRFRSGQRETKLLLHRACQKSAHAGTRRNTVLTPAKAARIASMSDGSPLTGTTPCVERAFPADIDALAGQLRHAFGRKT